MAVEVELASPRFRGQTVGWEVGLTHMFDGGPPNADVAVDVDLDRFMALFLDLFDARAEV
jgi:inosine-uridine nucleoside N-ribohydrolase